MAEESMIEETSDQLIDRIKRLEAKNEQLIGINKKITEKLEQEQAGKKQMMEAAKEEEERRLIESGDVTKLVEWKTHQAINAKDEKIREVESRYENAARELEQLKIGNIAREAAEMAGIRPDAQDMAMLMVRDKFRMVDDRLVGYDTATGRELLNENGESLSVLEFLQKEAQRKDYLFEQQHGSGSRGGRAQSQGLKKSDMTLQQKSEFVAKHGQDAFMNLPS